VRPEPRRGGLDAAEPRAVRGRATHRTGRGRGRRPYPGREEVHRMSERQRIQQLAHGALPSLERSRQRIDDLNVYPVPDGDTGTNLLLTVRSVVEALEGSHADDRATLV